MSVPAQAVSRRPSTPAGTTPATDHAAPATVPGTAGPRRTAGRPRPVPGNRRRPGRDLARRPRGTRRIAPARPAAHPGRARRPPAASRSPGPQLPAHPATTGFAKRSRLNKRGRRASRAVRLAAPGNVRASGGRPPRPANHPLPPAPAKDGLRPTAPTRGSPGHLATERAARHGISELDRSISMAMAPTRPLRPPMAYTASGRGRAPPGPRTGQSPPLFLYG